MKKPYSILYLLPAEKDAEELWEFIRKDSPSRALQFLTKVDRSISRLARFPLSGIVPKDPYLKQKGYRVLILDNYLVFYKVWKETIVIHRILHGRRKFEFLL